MVIIYAVVNNFLSDVPVEELTAFEGELFDYIEGAHPEIYASIRETKDLLPETVKAMAAAIEECKARFLAGR